MKTSEKNMIIWLTQYNRTRKKNKLIQAKKRKIAVPQDFEETKGEKSDEEHEEEQTEEESEVDKVIPQRITKNKTKQKNN